MYKLIRLLILYLRVGDRFLICNNNGALVSENIRESTHINILYLKFHRDFLKLNVNEFTTTGL